MAAMTSHSSSPDEAAAEDHVKGVGARRCATIFRLVRRGRVLIRGGFHAVERRSSPWAER
jgi:hypothetical protein